MALTTRGSRLGIPLLLLFALLLGVVSSAHAGTDMCSGYKKSPTDTVAVIDGNDPFVQANLPSSSFGIDMNCEFRNFPRSATWPNGLTPTLNFYTPNKTEIYLIVFDNVWFSGNMACANIDHKLWVVNSEEGAFSGSCQDIMIPAETIYKQTPAATATIGLPFTYTLTIPSMQFPVGAASPNDLGSIVVSDDLTATGASLTLVSLNAYYKGSGTSVPITNLGDTKHVRFTLPNIAAGQQIIVEVTAVLDDTPTNMPGMQFINTATWQFSRWIDLDADGIIDANEFFNPLPGESGISAPMTIVAPSLVVNKTSPATALNLGDMAAFTINVQNSGGGDAWNATIADRIPVGMCVTDPTATLSARIVQSDGATLVRTLAAGADYTVSPSPYAGGCQFSLTLTDAAGPIAPGQRLIITYQTQLDPGFTNDGATLTNVAGAVRWFSADSGHAGRREFARTLTDGTPTVVDFQDSQAVQAALHGYYFEKTAQNLTSLESPATTAAPGDTLHYRLRVFNVDQTINTITINDTLDLTVFDPATLRNVTILPPPGYSAGWTFNSASGLLQIYGTPVLDVKVGGQLMVEFDITLRPGLVNGATVSNQATLSAAGGFTALSDNPYVNGVASPDVTGDEDPTNVTIWIPGPLAKANTKPTATIGERFEYIITVPATPTSVPLYDVRILDTLPANLRFVSSRVVTGGAWALSNTGTGNSVIIQDLVTGIDIPANSQARIAITVELLNSAPNQSSVFFNNSASYTYNRANGIGSTQLAGGAGTTANMTVAEPLLTAAKMVSFVSPAGKPATDPATVGDVIEYRISIPNSGTSTAFDANIVDTLPASVAPVAGSATATINGVAVSGFVATPATPSGTTLVWGRGNGDGSLDVPAGQPLVLTYRVTVVDASSAGSFTNSAYVDWTSLDEDYPIDISNPAPGRERTGAGCPATALPNDYCAGPASVTVTTADNTSIAKSVNSDSYAETPASTTDPIVRVGDTVTYDLTLSLQEYTTGNVVVEDALPAGMALQSFTIIGSPYFSYTLGVQPAAGATGTVRWEFGDIINTPSNNNTPIDTLVIRYVAKVVTDAPPAGVGSSTSIPLENHAKLSYTGGDPAVYPARLTTAEQIDVRQPQMGTISKVDLGTGRFGTGTAADPYQVNIAADVMKFRLSSCNIGLAPAYNVQLSDLLASQLNESSITPPVVTVGGTTLTSGTDYTYTPPAGRGGSMLFVLNAPVNPGQCVTADYTIGFHTDIPAGQTWSNQARLPQYGSLPSNGRLYAPPASAQVWMTNQVSVQPLVKTLVSPASPAEATIGETVIYHITVPGTPVNASLGSVVITDTLHAALSYVNATATLNGAPLAITTTQSGQTLTWALGTIPAGQQAVITLTASVANNSDANAGTSIANSASYTYTGIPAGAVTSGASGPLTIVEPSVTIVKGVNPTAPPSAGDILHYTVTLTAASGANFSSAFDAGLVDTLSLGLGYVAGTARVGGVAVEPTVAGDGVSIPQTLTWAGSIDIPEGASVSTTYDVRVLATVVAGQALTNSVTAQWTGLDGANGNERNGSGTPAYNDYVTGPVTTRLVVSDNNSLTKAIIADTYVDAPSTAIDKIVRIGDTATYRLTLKLGEGTTRSVRVQDVLPAGMAYDSLVSITPASGSSTFTYAVVSQPAPGATGTLTWDLGTVVNTPSNNNTPFDALIIEYTATVQPNTGIAQAQTTSLPNTATLSYLDAGGNTVVDPARLVSSDALTLRQPVMSPIVKLGNNASNTAATPLNVNVATDTVHFQLRSCNTNGLAPAYSVRLTDVLASQLNESSITPPVVAVGGTTLVAGAGYAYTAPAARGGSMLFVLTTPVNPGQCVTVDYNIGFHNDFGPNQTWNNSASLNEYWSLPAASGQQYTPAGSAQFYMTNNVSVAPLVKTLVSPVSPAEATIGETVTYHITAPGMPVNASLSNVVITDTLHTALAYVSATATLNGAPLAITTTQSGQTLTWALGTIPAGQQAVITLTVRVANNSAANAGTSIVNTASYSYTGIPAGAVTSGASGPLTIVEPSATIAKTVSNVTQPGAAPKAGDVLRYTVSLTAASGANFSSAFDAALVDTLSLGLAYQAGTSTVNGAGNAITDPTVNGDGSTTPQTLTWDLVSSTADIDIVEGSRVTVTYDVQVLNTVVAGQVLTNSVTTRWTGLDGANSNERTGADGIGGLNDYAATAAAPPQTVPVPTLTLQKTVDKPIANPGDRLRYTITIRNPTAIRVATFSLVDESDRLNAAPMFQPGSIGNVTVPAGAGYSINGGTLNVTGLNIGPNETLTIIFEAVLQTNLKSGTVVLNQAELQGPWPTQVISDDPNVAGAANPTQTVIPADGVVYDAVSRRPLGGVTLSMQRASTGTPLPTSCFVDPSQQDQVTPANGTYKFDLRFDPTNCPEGADYLIAVTATSAGYVAGPSLMIVPASSASTAAYSVPACPSDAILSTAQCEAQVSATAPTGAATTYYLNLMLDSTGNQIFNNHIPVDPKVEEKVSIQKTSSLINVSRGQLVPYTITVKNTLRSTLPPLGIVDTLPAGFKYVEGSGRFDGTPLEPVVTGGALRWNNLSIGYNQQHTIKMILLVGAGVSEGEYANRAQVINTDTGGPFSEVATATVRIVPDPTFDCTDIIGKVFDDANANGYPDQDEKGLGGVRIVSARGLIATTDQYGRFHITCAAVPNEDRGSNFILKLDDRTLPAGYRITTENPLVHHLTRGKAIKFNFGATLHRVVRLDIADGVFEPGSTEMRPQWRPRIEMLLSELRKAPALLRISYLADVEDKAVVKARTEAVKREIAHRWERGSYELTIETEIFWRRGGPPAGSSVENEGKKPVSAVVTSGANTSAVQAPPAASETRVLEAPALGQAVEKHAGTDEPRTLWVRDGDADGKQGDTVEMKKVLEKAVKTIKVQNLVPPIHFASGEAQIPEGYVERLREALDSMKGRANVRLHFVGHSDNAQLRGKVKEKYGDNLTLSRERAGVTAEHFQKALHLPSESITYEGMGESQPVASNATEQGKALNRRVEVEVWYDEITDKLVDKEVVVAEQIKRVKVCRVETVCKVRYKEGHAKRARIKNLVEPLHFDDDTTAIPDDFVQKMRQALTNLRTKEHVVVKFIGYTDNLPLSGRAERVYGSAVALSKARARRAALAIQDALKLPASGIDVDGRGGANPIASNDTEKGRALNRRIEVEFWYDDALQELSDEPRLCPEAAGAEIVTRVYDPPSGGVKPILFENGKPVLPAGCTEQLHRIMDEIKDKTNVRLRFVGYTNDERLARRTAMVYEDDIGLSTARARRAMNAVKEPLGLKDEQAEFEGRGYVQSADVVNTGFVESDTARVEVQVVYDELMALDDTEGMDITRFTREVAPKDPLALNLMRITIDGKPVDDPGKGIADIERCTDVALNKANVQFKFDNLDLKPRLAATAWPNSIRYQDDPNTEYPENLMRFRTYTNYAAFIKRSEIRIFDAHASVSGTPLVVIEVNKAGRAEWQPSFTEYTAPGRELKYVLRVYDADDHFDETKPLPVWIVDRQPAEMQDHDGEKELLVGYGENHLAADNIPKNGGTVKVYGSEVPADHAVFVAGSAVPVGKEGKFVTEEILPPGMHTVEVAILDASGNGDLFLRDLDLKKNDWFYVGIADVTVARDSTTGAAKAVTNDQTHYNNEFNTDGRLAFYTKGKFSEGWELTSSADTLEGPLKDIFSNIGDRSADALFRRIDPQYFYPTYGDDGSVEEGAPTLGKFYLKMKKDESYGLWGNFRIGYTDNDLAHVDRGLYGANAHYQTLSTTSFGEKRFLVDGFAAQPGTVGTREEFLGTGGSLYFLRHQDILAGSERVRIEVRDKDSGIVTSVRNLTPTLDYTVDYLQGRILLSQPLSPTASDNLLVTSDTVGGNPVYLVARYEYVPSAGDTNSMSLGGRTHVWLNDYVKLGITSSEDRESENPSGLNAADLTFRKSAESWIKVETSRSKGPGLTSLSSSDGGFTFSTTCSGFTGTTSNPACSSFGDPAHVSAGAYRIDTSIGFKDIIDGANGQMMLYTQSLDAGYSAPGLATATDTKQFGGTLKAPVTDRINVTAKADSTSRQQGLETTASEVDVNYLLTEHWTLSPGVRLDSRVDHSPVVPPTQMEGDRTDAAVRATYDSKKSWTAYGFLQDTVSKTGNREDNDRVGTGGAYRVTDRFKVIGEVSTGDLGGSGKVGTEYLYSDRTNLYLNYAYDNETPDNGIRSNKGNLITGVRTRYTDTTSIYAEEKYTHGKVPTGLTHSAGVDLAPFDHWNFGANVDFGTLRDPITAARLERNAAGVRVGYGAGGLALTAAFEYRVDKTDTINPDMSVSTVDRDSWLIKTSFRYQIDPASRLLGKLNYAESTSSGSFYDGRYTEAVLGYGYRPVTNDRLNTLFKYTYFYNLPSTGQVTDTVTTTAANTVTTTPADFTQKSHIVSLDASYDLTRRWTIGGKYAYRLGQISEDRETQHFFDSRAHLYVLRVDWHFVHQWDALVEGRLLDLPDAQDRLSGALLGIYRHLGNNIKLGVGYNFSKFSDDLTQLDYKHQGLFINLIGKF